MTEHQQEPTRPGPFAYFFLGVVLAGKAIVQVIAEILRPRPSRIIAVIPARDLAAAPPGQPVDETGRAADVKLKGSRPNWGTLFCALGFAVGAVSAVGFLFTYFTDGSNQLLGGTLALSFAGFGAALVLWAHLLMRHTEATEPREPAASSYDDRHTTVAAFDAGRSDVQRRNLLKWMIGTAIGIFAAMAISLLRSVAKPPGPELFDEVWKRGQHLTTLDGNSVTVQALEPGQILLVFPEDRVGDEKAQTALIRVKKELLQLPSERADWAPEGYVAYSRVCTHAGCAVGLFEAGLDMLLCPCHQSTFDVLRAAKPTGGPAARPLPQLPLYADADGTLRAAGGFSAPPGPGFWEMP
ncbi:MAG TPA: Rieske 2Fe-2S domain-containing protein [Terriglobia bacterium]|nr:Rieske 2Fe-2S domain-containing protein [Terriglobia bacterium]